MRDYMSSATMYCQGKRHNQEFSICIKYSNKPALKTESHHHLRQSATFNTSNHDTRPTFPFPPNSHLMSKKSRKRSSPWTCRTKYPNPPSSKECVEHISLRKPKYTRLVPLVRIKRRCAKIPKQKQVPGNNFCSPR